MKKQTFHISILLLAIWNCAVALAQNVTTLTPTAFDATGGLSVAADGNIFLANWGATNEDPEGDEIYRITPEGDISVFVNGLGGSGNAFDHQGNLYQANWLSNTISKITPGGTITEFANVDDGLNAASDMAFDSQGNMFVANCRNYNILKITPGGNSSVFFQEASLLLRCPAGIDVDNEDNIYVSNYHNPFIVKITPAGQGSAIADTSPWTGQDSHNMRLVFTNGRLYLVSQGANRVLEVSLEGEVSVLAGTGEAGNDDGPLLQATFSRPWSIDVSPDGRKLYVNTSDPPPANPARWTPNLVRVIEIPGLQEEGVQINAGHSGAWYNPETSGQGLLLDVEPEDQYIFLAWFTYTDADSANPGEPHWFTAQGTYSGDSATLPVYLTLGGRFDDSQAVIREVVGELTLQFDNCDEGTVTYAIDAWEVQGAFPVQRLIPGSNNVCQQHAGPGVQAVDINTGMDGGWYDPATSGQGLLLDVHADATGGNYIFVAWFTYGDDTASGQRWLTAQGGFEGATASIDVFETTGGLFDDSRPVSTGPVGAMTIDFADCSNATLSYTLANEGREGIIDLTRLLPKGKSLCEGIASAQ